MTAPPACVAIIIKLVVKLFAPLICFLVATLVGHVLGQAHLGPQACGPQHLSERTVRPLGGWHRTGHRCFHFPLDNQECGVVYLL